MLASRRGLAMHEHGWSIAVGGIDLSLSAAADSAEAQAPYGSDTVVWEDLESRLRARSTISAVQLAGMVALTAAKSGAVLGVLVLVTTIPAAGNCAVALAFGAALCATAD